MRQLGSPRGSRFRSRHLRDMVLYRINFGSGRLGSRRHRGMFGAWQSPRIRGWCNMYYTRTKIRRRMACRDFPDIIDLIHMVSVKTRQTCSTTLTNIPADNQAAPSCHYQVNMTLSGMPHTHPTLAHQQTYQAHTTAPCYCPCSTSLPSTL